MSVVGLGLCDGFIERSSVLSNGGDPKFPDFVGHNFYSLHKFIETILR